MCLGRHRAERLVGDCAGCMYRLSYVVLCACGPSDITLCLWLSQIGRAKRLGKAAAAQDVTLMVRVAPHMPTCVMVSSSLVYAHESAAG